MISHVCLGTLQLARAKRFYDAVLGELGWTERFLEADRGWAGWEVSPGARPLFIVGRPFDGQPPVAGNGGMVALLAPDRGAVDRAHAAALSFGARCEGAPGLRPHYHPDFYGAYFRDADGHKICVCTHAPVPDGAVGDGKDRL